MSRLPARHRKPRSRNARRGAHARYQKPITSTRSHRSTLITAAVAGSTLVVSAAVAPALVHWTQSAPPTSALDQAGGAPAALPSAGASGAHADQVQSKAVPTDHPTRPPHHPIPTHSKDQASSRRTQAPARTGATHTAPHHHARPPAAGAAVYQNPLRGISGLMAERVDMGVDFGGSGPIYAIGDGVITNAMAGNAGWPGGGWITYRLTDGPGSGLMVYVAEDVTPNVQVGQTVTPSTVIATMFNGGAGIETGWAMPDGSSAESQLPEAGGISGGGPFPTEIGLNFEALLQTLGVPASPYMSGTPSGTLPSNYPTNWTAATKPK